MNPRRRADGRETTPRPKHPRRRKREIATLVVRGAAEVITCVPTREDPIGRIRDGSIALAGERIVAVGTNAEVRAAVDARGAPVIDARGKVAAPGFVDSHTHLVFGGSRVREYAARLTRTREEVEALGIPMGIRATVDMTRAASTEELLEDAKARLAAMLRAGTTTVESKSGYGLRTRDELRLLEVNRRLAQEQPADIMSTFLGAHDFPPDMSREAYLEEVIGEMIPAVAGDSMATFCDVFCDEGYYGVEESRRVLEAGLEAGLAAKIHTDQYSAIGGAAMIAELARTASPGEPASGTAGRGNAGASGGTASGTPGGRVKGSTPAVVSADHLNYATRADLRKLANAGVVGVVTPVLDFAVQHPRPFNARAMLEEGMTIAIATDLCPACWVESMQLALSFACRSYAISVEEAVLAATAGGAAACRLDDRGTLEPGKLADIQVWDIPCLEDLVYRLGENAVHTVIKRGRVVV